MQFIQSQIGYDFKNPDLLQQSFVCSSYAEENGGPDNEILEFIGDKALDIAAINYLIKQYDSLAEEDVQEYLYRRGMYTENYFASLRLYEAKRNKSVGMPRKLSSETLDKSHSYYRALLINCPDVMVPMKL